MRSRRRVVLTMKKVPFPSEENCLWEYPAGHSQGSAATRLREAGEGQLSSRGVMGDWAPDRVASGNSGCVCPSLGSFSRLGRAGGCPRPEM